MSACKLRPITFNMATYIPSQAKHLRFIAPPPLPAPTCRPGLASLPAASHSTSLKNWPLNVSPDITAAAAAGTDEDGDGEGDGDRDGPDTDAIESLTPAPREVLRSDSRPDSNKDLDLPRGPLASRCSCSCSCSSGLSREENDEPALLSSSRVET